MKMGQKIQHGEEVKMMNTERWAGQEMEMREKVEAAKRGKDMKETTLRYESYISCFLLPP